MSETISTYILQLAERAKDKTLRFRSVYRRINEEALREAYRRVRKDGAVGVDGVSGEQYGAELDANLTELLERLKTGRYRAQPARRVWIEKPKGGRRPLGIPAFCDKLVQKATQMLLTPIYEVTFYGCSHGYRPGRGAHTALRELREQCIDAKVSCIIDADIRGFFDSVDHRHLKEFVQRRIDDRGIIRLIGKWLNAGILEGGQLSRPEEGTPQGSVISPLLANVFLHYVLDEWFMEVVKPRMQGKVFLVRYCDDFIIGCAKEDDARRIMDVLPKRLGKYGLELHPDKVRLIRFRRPPPDGEKPRGGTFDFLGFTHYWGRSLRGHWVIKRKTAKDRLSRTLMRLEAWCKAYRHKPLADQHAKLCQKLRGHYQYFGLSCNIRSLLMVRHRTARFWHKWLSRRSTKSYIPWATFRRILTARPLPVPRIRLAV